MYLGAGAPQATIGVRGGFRGSRVPSDTSTWELFDEIHGVVAQFVWIGHWNDIKFMFLSSAKSPFLLRKQNALVYSRWAGSHISATDVSQIVLEPLKSLSARTMCQIILCGVLCAMISTDVEVPRDKSTCVTTGTIRKAAAQSLRMGRWVNIMFAFLSSAKNPFLLRKRKSVYSRCTGPHLSAVDLQIVLEPLKFLSARTICEFAREVLYI